jgi:hypothetical protein
MEWKESGKCPWCDADISMMFSYDEYDEYEDWYCTRQEVIDGEHTCGWSEMIYVRDISHLLK